MRVAFASDENKGLESIVSDKFGRAKYFVIVEVEDGDSKLVGVVENPGTEAKSGAGMKAVQKLVEEGVEAVVAGGFGPNALAGLEELGIKHYEAAGLKVSEALEKLFMSS